MGYMRGEAFLSGTRPQELRMRAAARFVATYHPPVVVLGITVRICIQSCCRNVSVETAAEYKIC